MGSKNLGVEGSCSWATPAKKKKNHSQQSIIQPSKEEAVQAEAVMAETGAAWEVPPGSFFNYSRLAEAPVDPSSGK